MQFLDISDPSNFTVFVTCVGIFATVYFNNRKMRRDIRKDNQDNLDKKADLLLVERKHIEFDTKFNEVEKSMKSITVANNNQHIAMLNKIEEVGKGVARIEGYLNAKKEK